MSGFVLSPRARADLDDIWTYTFEHWGVDQAETYLRGIQAAILLIAENPALGRACDDVRAGYLKYPAGSHLLFYRLAANDVDIVRILHQRMDFTRQL